MQSLTKNFTTLLSSTNKNLRKQLTIEICSNITEYKEDFNIIFTNLYKMLESKLDENVIKIIKALRKNKMLLINFTNKEVPIQLDKTLFLGATGEQIESYSQNYESAKKEIMKVAGIDERFVKLDLISEEDVKMSKRELIAMKRRGKKVEEKKRTVENLNDFFLFLIEDLLSKEWSKRNSAFLILNEMIKELEVEIENETEYENIEQKQISIKNDTTTAERNNGSNEKKIVENNSLVQICDNCVIFNIPSSILTITVQVLYSDRLSDFVTDQISLPVREKAAEFLSHIYHPCVDPFLFEFLNDKDWQVQCSALLAFKNLKNKIDMNCITKNLIELLHSKDEDIRYFSADLLCYLDNYDYQLVLNYCWNCFSEENEIAIGRMNILKLMVIIYNRINNACCEEIVFESDISNDNYRDPGNKNTIGFANENNNIQNNDNNNIEKNDNNTINNENIFSNNKKAKFKENNGNNMVTISFNLLKKLIPSFRSPLSDVRLTILKMLKETYLFLDDESKNTAMKCLIENILLDENENIQNESAYLFNLFTKNDDIILYYLNLISTDLSKEYQIDEFIAKSDEILFSDSGVRLVGKNEIFKGRCKFIKVVYEYLNELRKNNSSNLKNYTVLLDSQNNRIYGSVISSVLFNSFGDYRNLFPKNILVELENKIKNKNYEPKYNIVNEYFLDYLRITLDKEIFEFETSAEFIDLVSYKFISEDKVNNELLLFLYTLLTKEETVADEPDIKGNELINKSYTEIKSHTENTKSLITKSNEFSTKSKISKSEITKSKITLEEIKFDEKENLTYLFFKQFDISENSFFNFIKTDPKRIVFFSKIIQFLDKSKVGFVFYEAMKNYSESSCIILNHFIVQISFCEELVNFINLDLQSNLKMLDGCIENINFSFYPLFLKGLLNIMNNNDNESISLIANKCFSYIVPYLNIKKIHTKITNETKEKINDVLNKLEESRNYKIIAPLKIELRKYQVEGVKWMGFLYQNGVNGVLADDMGLGKTIMVLAFLSNEIYIKRFAKNGEYIETNTANNEISNIDLVKNNIDRIKNNADSKNCREVITNNDKNCKTSDIKINDKDTENTDTSKIKTNSHEKNNISLVIKKNANIDSDYKILIISPSSLTSHWEEEINTKFDSFLSCKIYKKKKNPDSFITIVSFESFRLDYLNFINDSHFFIIIDEGHVLRNRDTVLYKRIVQLKSQHKLILTGTPVHNSVDDIFSLFNFLMPNYLGSSETFYKNYVKIINMAKEAKSTDRDFERAEKRLNLLKKRLEPFILRRLKTDVLTDLPPKIVVDLKVEMDEFERTAYEKYTEESDFNYGKKGGFTKVKGMLRVCSHKKYFMDDLSKENNYQIENEIITKEFEEEIIDFERNENKKCLKSEKTKINIIDSKKRKVQSYSLSAKVKALFDIFNSLGANALENKILIFCQLKSTIDYLINDIKNNYDLKYLRIDGSTKPESRVKIANEFNNTDINILLLTTGVGGLGLNLTSANTVIMYEHDWNPFNDLQAMDRAHRIGQKRIVNVYRLIVKDTIEERVMNLQSFKLFVAGSIVEKGEKDAEYGDVLERFGEI